MSTEAKSFCRICSGLCGVTLTLDGEGLITGVAGDKAHPMTAGYACVKGLQAAEIQNGPSRLLGPLKRRTDGTFQEIGIEQALDEIAEKLIRISAEHGPNTVATFNGTPNFMNSTGFAMVTSFASALGTTSMFSTRTIDQPAKMVAIERMGRWRAGKQQFSTADVTMFFGTNPLVTVIGPNLFSNHNPTKSMKDARARGLKVIVIDPRFTETARYADVFLQPYPGEDPTVAAGLLRIILSEGWEDGEFCDTYVANLDELRRAVAPFTPDYVARRAGLDAGELRRAAELFAHSGRRGTTGSGTGPDMSARSNLAEHLIEAINVVCGRFLRAGDIVDNPGVIGAPRVLRAEVAGPRRTYERGRQSRVGEFGMLVGEMMAGTLPDEIVTSGPGQIRSLIVIGGNPALMMPDQVKTVTALKALDLLVTIDPVMSETARLADYVLAPTTQYERADIIHPAFETIFYYDAPFAQYAPALAKPPAGSEVADDWYFLFGLAQRMGLQLTFEGVEVDMARVPTTTDLIALLTRHAQVPFEEFSAAASGMLCDVPVSYVQPGRPDANERFDVMPPDVAAELATVAAEPPSRWNIGQDGEGFTHLLITRRMRELMNSAYRELRAARRRFNYNPAWIDPSDLIALNLDDGASVELVSRHGRVPAILASDATLKPGVIAMTHGWGRLPDEDEDYADTGAAVNRLTSLEHTIEPITAMARLSGIPIRIEARAEVSSRV